jgi:protein-S-isoprenylcysteine O-methyltransferase Ste14
MNPWFAKAAVLLGSIALIAIRAPHGARSRKAKVLRSRKDRREVFLLAGAWIAFFLPLMWVATPWLEFADYPLLPAPFAAGVLALALGLWLFYRSHADLGRNWSITLEVRERHVLITRGIYSRIRHPMYLALFLYSAGMALVLPNWVAGPAYLVSFGLLFVLRIDREERMMLEEFGPDYQAYMARTKRLVPGVW